MILRRVVHLGLAAVMMLGVSVARAADTSQSSPRAAVTGVAIVVVDTNRVQRDSTAGRAVATEREKYQQGFNSQFESTRKELQAAEQDLARQRSGLANDEFQDKVRALNSRVADFQRRYQGAVRALDKSTSQAGNELQKAIIEVTGEVASEMGAGLVLHKQHVFLHDERMDITNTIIERMNKRYPTLAFPPPAIDPADAAPQGKK